MSVVDHVSDLEAAAKSSIDAGQTVCAVDARTLLNLVMEVQRLRDEIPNPPGHAGLPWRHGRRDRREPGPRHRRSTPTGLHTP